MPDTHQASSAAEGAPSHHAALSHAPFRRYFAAACLSTMGTWISRFLLGWSAWELTHAALWVGITSAVMLLPTFVLSPVFGVVSDRISPRNGLLVTLGSQGLLAAVAAIGMALELFDLRWLLALAIGLGAITAAHQPLRLALVPRLVPREALPGAIGVSAIVFNLSRILGPAAAGWLLAHGSAALAFSVAALLFAGACLPVLLLRNITADGRNTGEPLLVQLRAGMRYAREHGLIRCALLFTLFNGLLGRTVIELLPALSGKLLSGTATTLAILTGAAGAGSIIGGLLLTRHRSDEATLLRMIERSLVGASLTLLVAWWADTVWVAAAMILALSLATTMVGTGSQALAQLAVNDAYRGRVLSLWTVFTMGAPAIGSFVMGAAADWLGFIPVLITAALLALVATHQLSRGLKAPMPAD